TNEVTQIPGSEGTFNPQWSPDGRYLSVQGAPDQRTLRLLEWKTGKWDTWVSGEPWSVSHSMWSRDSQYVYYQNGPAEKRGLFRVRVRDRKVEQLASLDDMR